MQCGYAWQPPDRNTRRQAPIGINCQPSNRAVYTVKFPEAVFVLHWFHKKSKRDIATPKEDLDTIHARLKIASAYVKALRK
jgi:phage-related protein